MAEEFVQENRENAEQQITVYLDILNYLFTQKTILCAISVFWEADKWREPVGKISSQKIF